MSRSLERLLAGYVCGVGLVGKLVLFKHKAITVAPSFPAEILRISARILQMQRPAHRPYTMVLQTKFVVKMDETMLVEEQVNNRHDYLSLLHFFMRRMTRICDLPPWKAKPT